MNVKMTFTIPEDVAQRPRAAIADRRRSAFVASALKQKLEEAEHEQVKALLIQGYVERYEEDRAINEEWEAATLESWDAP